MQVVVIADFADAGGGAQRVALESARALAEAGVAVTYVHAVGPSGIAALGHPRIEDIASGSPTSGTSRPRRRPAAASGTGSRPHG